MKLSVVVLYDVGMEKACLHAFKECIKLRICVKIEEKAKIARARNLTK